MARIFIRVELHNGASYSDYAKLHIYMASNNWFRSVNAKLSGESGYVSRNLPTATYAGDSDNVPINIANALAGSISTNVWKRNTVLVMRTEDSWGIAGEQIA